MGGKSKSSSSKSTSASTQNLNAQGNTAPLSVPSIDVKGGKYTKANVNLDVDQSRYFEITENNTQATVSDSGNTTVKDSNNTITDNRTVTDFGAISGALGLSKSALEYYEKINSSALSKITEANSGVLEFATAAIGEVSEAMRSDDADNYNNLIKWVVIGGVLIVGVGAFKK